eukprot:5837654-Pyramimonas_sp.AAC.1
MSWRAPPSAASELNGGRVVVRCVCPCRSSRAGSRPRPPGVQSTAPWRRGPCPSRRLLWRSTRCRIVESSGHLGRRGGPLAGDLEAPT